MARVAAPDPRKGVYVFASGKKGSGKSVICREWFNAYPFDKIAIDPTHDIRSDLRRDGVEFTELHAESLPARLPPFDPEHPKVYVFCPDMGSATALDDMDRVAGFALGRGPTCLWCDEYGTQTSANMTGPNMRRILHHGRHDGLTLLLACPRPKNIDGLGISQADYVYTFRTKNPDDRDRIAKEIGMDPADFSAVNASLSARGPYWHTMHDDAADQLWIMPPLPVRKARHPGYPTAVAGDLTPQQEPAL